MKVIQLCGSIYPYLLGGVEIHVRNLTDQLVKKGHEVRIIVTRENIGKSESQILSCTNVKAILAMLDDEHYDCLHIHSFKSLGILELGIVLLFNKVRKRKPVVITPHGSFNSVIYGYYGISLKFFLQRVYVLYLRKLSALVNYFIVFTAHQRDLWKRLGFPAEKVVVLPPFVDLGEGTERLSANTNNKVVLYVGRLSKEKGIDFLIRAIPNVLDRISNVKLHIVGEGQARGDLIDLACELDLENEVIFHGQIPHEKLEEIYKRSDVFVLPSLSAEGFPLALVEAMKYGLPVVTTNIGGQSEIVKQGFNGELVNPRDPDDLAEKISILLSHPELAKVLGKNARMSVRNLGPREHVERLEEVYKFASACVQ